MVTFSDDHYHHDSAFRSTHNEIFRRVDSAVRTEKGAFVRGWARRVFGWDVLIAALALAILGGCISGTYRWIIARTEAAAVEDAVNGAQHDARRLADYWATVLERVARLQDMARIVTLDQQTGDTASTANALAELRMAISVSIPGITQVSAVDTKGYLLWSSLTDHFEAIDLSDRRNVKAILQEGRDFFIGQPVVGKISGQRTIQFTASTREDDGKVVGMSVVSFDLQRAQELAREIGRYDRDVVTLVRDDGLVLARSRDRAVGSVIDPKLAVPRQYGAAKFPFIRGSSQIDGVPRIVVRQDLPGKPMSVFVGLDEDAELADQRVFTRHLGIWAAFLYGVLTLLAVAAVVTLRQHRRIEDQRVQGEAKTARDGLLREIADASQHMTCVLDETLSYIYVNPAVERLTGHKVSDMIGRPAGVYLAPNVQAELRAALQSLSAAGASCLLTLPLTTMHGESKWMEVEASRVELPASDAQKKLGWFFVKRDVTARKAAEDALISANDNLRAVVQSGPGFLYRGVLPPTGGTRIGFLQGDHQGFMGYDQEEWYTDGFARSHVHPDDLAIYDQKKEMIARTGKAILEYRFCTKDGPYAWMRDTANGIPQDDGGYVLSGYALDISSEKEQAAKLEQARRMLSLGELASGIGHEINQPLAVISMAAQNTQIALERDPANTAYLQKALDRIVEFTARASGIIDNMRNFGRQDSQAAEAIQLSDAVAETVKIFQARLTQEGIAVVIDMPPALPPVRVPPVPFQQVLINMLGNACDAYRSASETVTGVRDIRIAGQVVDRSVRLRVQDRAGGVPPSLIERIFEPFFTTKGKKRGTGLGLSICYAIIRQASGTLSVHNEDGGAVFEITLPIDEEVAQEIWTVR